MSGELEDLTGQLFQQANDMVAAERKENAALKEQLKVLEKRAAASHDAAKLARENEKLRSKIQSLEQRDLDRKRRMERLESANKRIERVRNMLAPPP